jgi:hypothetical protein
MPTFLSAMSPLALIVLLVFLFAVALVVALWSLLTLGSSPRGVAVARIPKRKKVSQPKPLPSNRFMKQRLEADLKNEDVLSELPTDHVSRSRVRILKTLEPDPELETPAFKPTTYDQIVKSQRVPKTASPKASLPKTELITDSLHIDTPKPVSDITVPKVAPRVEPTIQQAFNAPPRAPSSPLRGNTEDTSTQPSLFDSRNKRPETPKPQPVEPRPHQPSVQRAESETAFRANQHMDTPQPKTQQEKDEAFENFLRKNDDLGF